MKLKINFIPDNLPCDSKLHFMDGAPESITIHWTGPYPGQTPEVVRQWWIDSKGEASAHFIVKDDEVLQCWPLDKVAWHAGCRIGNLTSIGIEVIPCDTEGRFSDRSIETLRELLNTLPDRPLIRHYDWTGKECPKFYVDRQKWIELLNVLGRRPFCRKNGN